MQNLKKNFENLKNFHFSVLLLSKVYMVWAKKVQRSYISWNWRGIKNLETNRLVLSKLTQGIWQILTWALESLKTFHFNRLLLSKVYIVWAKDVNIKKSNLRYVVPLNVLTIRSANLQLIRFCWTQQLRISWTQQY